MRAKKKMRGTFFSDVGSIQLLNIKTMKNKELAYDYINDYLFKSQIVSEHVGDDERLTEEDKNELLATLSTIGNMSSNARNFNALSLEEKEQSMTKVMQLNLTNIENTYETIMSIKSSLQDVIKDAKSAYKYVLYMYVAAFMLGIALMAVAVVFAARGETILAVAFGTIGLADLVTQFIYKPPLELQSSRSNLAQLMIAITNWFADLMNLNSYMGYKGTSISLKEISELSKKQYANTAQILDLIERYSEPSNQKNISDKN